VYARNAHAEKTVAMPTPVSASANLDATRAKPLLPRTMRLETPFGVQPTGAQGSTPPAARAGGLPPIAALGVAAVGMIVAVIAAILIFGSKKTPDGTTASATADPFPPPSAVVTSPVVGTVIGSSTPPPTATTIATTPATTTAPTTFKRPPRPIPSGSAASGKKCTPFDFDYPACLKH